MVGPAIDNRELAEQEGNIANIRTLMKDEIDDDVCELVDVVGQHWRNSGMAFGGVLLPCV